MNIPVQYKLERWVIFLAFLIFFVIYIFLDQSVLPDFESYQKIFESGGLLAFSLSEWEPFFIFLNYLGFSFGWSYEKFRFAIFVLSLLLLFGSILIVDSKEKKRVIQEVRLDKYQNSFIKLKRLGLISSLFMIFAMNVFMFEFFTIRIRGGLSIAIFSFALALLWPSKNNLKTDKLFLAFVLLFLSSLTHFSTFVLLSYIILVPFAIARLAAVSKRIVRLMYRPFFFLCSLGMMYIVLNATDSRGSHLDSELNVVRFITIAIIPIFIFLIFFSRGRLILYDRHYTNNFDVGGTKFKDVFGYFLTLNYFFMAFTLSIFYLLGLVDIAGEAIVRFYTLSSVIALFMMIYVDKRIFYFWAYLIIVNSLFFLNTIYR